MKEIRVNIFPLMDLKFYEFDVEVFCVNVVVSSGDSEFSLVVDLTGDHRISASLPFMGFKSPSPKFFNNKAFCFSCNFHVLVYSNREKNGFIIKALNGTDLKEKNKSYFQSNHKRRKLSDTNFEKELNELKITFKKERDRLLKRFRGKYVAFCKNELVAVGETYDEALSKAWSKTRHFPILIEKVVPEGEEETWLMVFISGVMKFTGR
ncbi:MAG: DUF5678 domain-containing protein [Candidatus Helarchaeales archaeon]